MFVILLDGSGHLVLDGDGYYSYRECVSKVEAFVKATSKSNKFIAVDCKQIEARNI